jgi:hypothetical protein
MWLANAAKLSAANAKKKDPLPAKKPRGPPLKDHHWDGKHRLVVSDDGTRSYTGTWVSDIAVEDCSDASGEEDSARAASKKSKKYRVFGGPAWLLVLPWLFVVANDSSAVCARGGSDGCPGCFGFDGC